jgi:serine/threonine protein kinase
LGVGGNAEVWEAQHANGIKAALKILRTKNPESEPYKRFTGEIEILRALGKRPGILPVIDASLPESPSQRNPAWLAMPIAIPIAKALGEAPPLESVVRAVAEVAGTLAG